MKEREADQRRSGIYSWLAKVGGSTIGGALGGPAGAVAGGQIGGGIGGGIAGMISGSAPVPYQPTYSPDAGRPRYDNIWSKQMRPQGFVTPEADKMQIFSRG